MYFVYHFVKLMSVVKLTEKQVVCGDTQRRICMRVDKMSGLQSRSHLCQCRCRWRPCGVLDEHCDGVAGWQA